MNQNKSGDLKVKDLELKTSEAGALISTGDVETSDGFGVSGNTEIIGGNYTTGEGPLIITTGKVTSSKPK